MTAPKSTNTATLGLENHTVHNTLFSLAVWQKWRNDIPTAIRIYIEGDGNAYVGKGLRSPNPTPRHPVALQLAQADPSPNVLYLARPCQYSGRKDNICRNSEWWTTKRFDPSAIKAMEQHVKHMLPSSITSIEWVGFSGGATYALALAPRFSETQSIRTVAGNLDPNFVHAWYKAPRMETAVNPLTPKTTVIPQLHFVGNEDKVITPALQRALLDHIPQQCSTVRTENATHTAGWQEQWPTLLTTPLPPCNS